MVIHKICSYCKKIGHKRDMIKVILNGGGGDCLIEWMHEDCYCKNFNVEKCPCGKEFIRKK